MANLPAERAYLPISPYGNARQVALALNSEAHKAQRFDRGQPVNALDTVKRETLRALSNWARKLSQAMHAGLASSADTTQPKAHAQHLINVFNLITDIKGVKVE